MADRMQIIRIICCVFPTGETFWMESVLGPVYLTAVVNYWKEQHPEYTKLNATGGMVELWMLRGDFEGQQENNMELPEDFHERIKEVENREDTN